MLYASFGTAVLVDSLIAVSLCILLVRNRTGFKQYVPIVHCLISKEIFKLVPAYQNGLRRVAFDVIYHQYWYVDIISLVSWSVDD